MTLSPTTMRHLARIIDDLPNGEDRLALMLVQQWIAYAQPLGFKLALLLDAAQPLMDAAAKREERAYAGMSLRQTTHQNRAKAAIAAVDDAETVFGDVR